MHLRTTGLPCFTRSVRLMTLVVLLGGLVVLTFLNLGWFIARSSISDRSKFLGRVADSKNEYNTEQKKAPELAAAGRSSQQKTFLEIDKTIDREMKRRLGVLDAACTRHKVPRQAKRYTAEFFNHLIVLDPYKLIFNFIPKVSCTAWKQVLSELMSKANTTQYKTLDKYSTEERNFRLETYRKVVFVREPITRLLSAWMSKFRGNPSQKAKWEKYFGKDIAKRYRQTEHGGESQRWLNVTFVEFAQYVTKLGPHYEIDLITDHFLPQSEIANPCQINYHLIGHFENLAVEGPYLLRWLSVDRLVGFPRFQPSAANRSLKDELMHVPLEVLYGLSKLYKRDYDMFDYSFMKTLDTVLKQ